MAEPREPEEITQEFLAAVTQPTDIFDPEESARITAIGVAAGQQVSAAETDLIYIADAQGYTVTGQALRDIAAKIPGFPAPQDEAPAQGRVMEFYRDDTAGTLTMPIGTIVTDGTNTYLTISPYTFLDGEDTYPGPGQGRGYIVCSQPGPAGNTPVGAIRRVVTEIAGVTGCKNVEALTNGLPAETDEQLQRRLALYRAGGLTQLPPNGLAAAILGFVSSDGTRAKRVTIREFPDRPYAEAYPDDGQGFAGLTRPAVTRSGIVPMSGQPDFWFDYPVVNDEVTLVVDGDDVPLQWVTLHERGRAIMDENSTALAPGAAWSCGGHTCSAGYMQECQAFVEGVVNQIGAVAFLRPDGTTQPGVGYRSTAVRVRLRFLTVEYVLFDILAVYRDGADADVVDARIRSTIITFCQNELGGGDPLLMLRLNAALATIDGLLNAVWRDPEDTSKPMLDVYPSGYQFRLNALSSGIKINGTVGT